MKLAEFFKPSLKCERVGHIEREQVEHGFAYPPENIWRHVADEVRRTRTVCKRCKKPLTDWATERQHGLNALTMDRPRWDELKEKGFVKSLT